jgi:predicted nuclease of predicted toxin-antitoxin system
MKFLVDVNAGGALSAWLTAAGHEVAEVTKRDPRMKDIDILHWAVDEQRVIVTTDQDFEERIWREQEPHCGVLRLENLPRRQRLDLLKDVLAHHAGDLQDGAIVIAQSRRIRIRKSP